MSVTKEDESQAEMLQRCGHLAIFKFKILTAGAV